MYKLHGQKYLDHILIRETFKSLFYAPHNETGLNFLSVYFKKLLYYIPIVMGWFSQVVFGVN